MSVGISSEVATLPIILKLLPVRPISPAGPVGPSFPEGPVGPVGPVFPVSPSKNTESVVFTPVITAALTKFHVAV